MAIRDFFEKTTKIFRLELRFNNETPDIRLDTISFILKKRKSDSDEEAPLLVEADVFSEGEDGVAIFTLTPEDTAIETGNYFYEIKWLTQGNEYILESKALTVLERVFD